MKKFSCVAVAVLFFCSIFAQNSPGLDYSYYEGNWTTLPNFFSMNPVRKGTSLNIDLSVRKRDLNYAMLWQGLITIPVAGQYTFDIQSDDGSKLYIGAYTLTNTPLIVNDGLHASNSISGTITLDAGRYPYTLEYFQGGGGQSMEAYWSSNVGLVKQKIPDNAFSRPAASIQYSYYEGNWNTMPDFSLLKPVKKGSGKNFNLAYKIRDTAYAMLFKGYITIPAEGTYTFETNSDDGSKLYIDTSTTALVDNNGLHASKLASGSMRLNAGTYPISVSYFQSTGNSNLNVFWSSNSGIPRQLIPDIAFRYPSTVVNYSYYEGTWDKLPDFDALTPVKKGLDVNLDLDIRSRDIDYGVVWKSFINIPASGDYTFEIHSDDGSRLYINNNKVPVIDNDGLHATTPVKSTIHLDKGFYPITVQYFQNSGADVMELYWSSNSGISRQLLPDRAFVSGVTSLDTTTQIAGLTGLRNFYLSTANGDDSRTSAEAQNPMTPWKTLTRLNTFFPSLEPGDAVLLNRGETFNGSINVTKSGAGSLPLIFSAYGKGAKPVINGFATATGWTSLGGNIYEASLPDGKYLNAVTINDTIRAKGRYPNQKYLTIDSRTDIESPYNSFPGPGTFTDAELPASLINWKGAEVVIRKNFWCLDKCPITDHKGTTISYFSPSPHTPGVGFGYFIQNDIRTLDVNGEWYYDITRHKIAIYSDVNPATLVVKGSVVRTLVEAIGKSHLMFDNLAFTGADTSVFNFIQGCSDITVQNCFSEYIGIDVVHAENSDHLSILNNEMRHTNNFAVAEINCTNTLVKGNYVFDVGNLTGMGLSNWFGYGAIYAKGSDNTVENNIVDSIGYCGIIVTGGSNILVKNNYVNNFCRIMADGGGIYTNGDNDFKNRLITGNVVTNGLGSYLGTPLSVPFAANGIYLDELSSNVEVRGNTVYNVVGNGIYLHQSYDNIVRDNTVVSSGLSALSIVDDTPSASRIFNDDITNNIFYAKKASQGLLNHGSTKNDLAQFGRYDSNYFSRPFDPAGYILTVYNSGGVYAFYDIFGFKNVYSDKGGGNFGAPAVHEYTVTKTGTNVMANGTFNDNVNQISSEAGALSALDVKLDGHAAKIYNNGAASIPDLVTAITIGKVTAGTTYRIRFSLLGSTNTQNLACYVRAMNPPYYTIVSEVKHFPLRTERTECEFLYRVTSDQNEVKLSFAVAGTLLPYWIDNVEAAPVEVTYNNIDDSIRFIYNETSKVKAVTLAGSYVDFRKNIYNNVVNIAPYSSVLLMKSFAQTEPGASANYVKPFSTQSLTSENVQAVNASLYPNPATDILAIKISSNKTGNMSLVIYDENGRIAQSEYYFKNEPTLEKTVMVGALKPGVYHLKATFMDGTMLTKSFVKK